MERSDILANVSGHAKPRRCKKHKLSLSDISILALQPLNFNRAVWVEENSDTF